MAFLNSTLTSKSFLALAAAYILIASLRCKEMDAEAFERLENAIDPVFWAMVRAPAETAEQIAFKGSCIVSEYGECGEIRVDLVRLLLRDVKLLD